jgi:predicted transcriptional regulator YheO
MTEMTVILTKTDRAILNSYKKICEGLSAYLGDGYEIVLHSLENFDHSVIQILNGSHTGRTIGAPITDLALTMLSQIRTKNDCGYICYHSKNKEGQPLKSTTITIAGENDRIIGLLCINFYLNTPLAKVLEQLMLSETQIREIAHPNETYVDRVDDLILQTVMQVRAEVM